MNDIALFVVAAAALLLVYAYIGYPAILWVLGQFTRRGFNEAEPRVWPSVSITVPAYNEEAQIPGLIESLLAIDYPPDRLQILIVSDCSSDRTDELVEQWADRGIELLRMPERGGKTRAENTAAQVLSGDIVVNTDASIRIQPDAVKHLVAALETPGVGCASGRDISVGPGQDTENAGEGGYVGYEMAVRDLETRVSGIVGSSGCLYATRRELHRIVLPEALSRDFASALVTREAGLRTVSVPKATCLVPRSPSLHKEYRRKVRTIRRGFETLLYKRALLNPFRYPVFSWMLVSHKLARWAVPFAGFAALVALGILAFESGVALALFVAALVIVFLAAVGWRMAGRGDAPALFSIPAYLVAGNVAAMVGVTQAFQGGGNAYWEPTRRKTIEMG